MENFVVINLDTGLVTYAGVLRRDYRKPFADMIIAASALERRASLITRNTKDFRRLKPEFDAINREIIAPY